MSEWIEGRRLRVYVGESDRSGGRSLYEAIVQAARRRGLRGATVFRGLEGYGAHSEIHAARVLALSDDLPILVEIIDAPDAIDTFLPELEAMIGEGTLTVDPVRLKSLRRPPG